MSGVAALSAHNAHATYLSVWIAVNLFYLYFVTTVFLTILYFKQRRPSKAILPSIFIMTFILANSWEAWLDYYCTLIVIIPIACVICTRMGRPDLSRRGFNVLAISTIIALPMIYIKIAHGWKYQGVGQESDVITNYKHMRPMLEDFVSNYFSFFYLGFKYFIPTSLFRSTILWDYGTTWIFDQRNIDSGSTAANYLLMNYNYLWRYAAGVIFAFFVALYCHFAWALYKYPSYIKLLLVCIMTSVIVGQPIHYIIKWDTFSLIPVLGYRVWKTVFTVTILIAFSLLYSYRNFNKIFGVSLIALFWVNLVWCALSLNGANNEIYTTFLNWPPLPDPLQELHNILSKL